MRRGDPSADIGTFTVWRLDAAMTCSMFGCSVSASRQVPCLMRPTKRLTAPSCRTGAHVRIGCSVSVFGPCRPAPASPSSPRSARAGVRAHRAGSDDRPARTRRPRRHGGRVHQGVRRGHRRRGPRVAAITRGRRLLRTHRRTASGRRRRPVVHRATPHRGRHPRPGRRRLAGADLGAVLPGDRGRPARDVVPPAVHARRGRADRLSRRGPRRPRRPATSRAAFPIRCWPRSAPPGRARCARSWRRSRPSRTS